MTTSTTTRTTDRDTSPHRFRIRNGDTRARAKAIFRRLFPNLIISGYDGGFVFRFLVRGLFLPEDFGVFEPIPIGSFIFVPVAGPQRTAKYARIMDAS